MDRRDFLRRTIGASAIAIINPAELLELLEPRRLIFPSIEIARPLMYTRVSALAEAYRRNTTKLYAAYSLRVDEYDWIDPKPDVFRAEYMGEFMPKPEPVEREPYRWQDYPGSVIGHMLNRK